jgi:hypothetical protein
MKNKKDIERICPIIARLLKKINFNLNEFILKMELMVMVLPFNHIEKNRYRLIKILLVMI